VNAYEGKAGMVYLQVILCDPCLSFEIYIVYKRRYINTLPLFFLYISNCSNKIADTDGNRMGRVCVTVCLFFQTTSQDDAARITKNDKCSTMSPRSPLSLCQKVKGHKICVGLQTQCNITAAAYVSHVGFSPAVLHNMAGTVAICCYANTAGSGR